MINKKLPALFIASLLTVAFLVSCSESEKKADTNTDVKTPADSAAISPMDTRDSGRTDTTTSK